MFPVIYFALNNTVHASTGFNPCYMNSLTHPRFPLTLPRGSGLGGRESADKLTEISPTTVQKQVSEFLATRFSILRHVRDAIANSQVKQKEQADA